MRMNILVSLSLLSLAATPAFAQDAMKSHDMMAKMSTKDMKMMKSCNAMSPAKAAKNAACARMMKAHPDMMKHDDMMKSSGSMSSDHMKKGS